MITIFLLVIPLAIIIGKLSEIAITLESISELLRRRNKQQ